MARDRLEKERGSFPKRALLAGMTKPGLFRVQLQLGRLLPGKKVPALLSRLLSGQAPEAERPLLPEHRTFPPLDESTLPPVKAEVYMLEGCVMRVLYPHVNEITRRMLRRIGYQVRDVGQGCCGALHAHNGFLDKAHDMAAGLKQALHAELPLIVNSAGCGSVLKENPNFAKQAFDASEFLVQNGLLDVLREAKGLAGVTATYHDACHLSHGQGIRSEPRALLKAVPGLTMVDLPEAEMCCGSAGIYNITQPKMARTLLERKWANVVKTEASVVATGNPGCYAWIAQAARENGRRIEVLHTLELLERAFGEPKTE